MRLNIFFLFFSKRLLDINDSVCVGWSVKLYKAYDDTMNGSGISLDLMFS